jgi:CubicO group peptidase (beta-lactamase class C family)
MISRATCLTLAAFCALVATAPSAPAAAPEYFPQAQWDHARPEDLGWSIPLLTEAERYSRRIGTSAVMIVQHGRIVAEWGDIARKSNVHSIRKSLLGALIGIAAEAEQVHLGDTLEVLGIDDDGPSLTASEKLATVADLLKARSGVYHPALYESPEMTASRPARGAHWPGTFWYYNNWDFNALGTIYERRTKQSIFDAFARKIAEPLGMQDYAVTDGQYVTGESSIHRAYPFRLSTRDLARFGLLYSRNGRWNGRQIVAAQWVVESTRSYSEPWTGLGYGYLWWTGFGSAYAPTLNPPKGMYFAWGAYGQYVFVLPNQDLIIVHRVDTDVPLATPPNERQIGRLLWLILSAAGLPDIGPDRSLAAVQGARFRDDELRHALADTTLQYGITAPEGPSLIRLRADGSASLARGRDERLIAEGSWKIEGSKLCSEWTTLHSKRECYAVVISGDKVDLFDADGIAVIEADIRSPRRE